MAESAATLLQPVVEKVVNSVSEQIKRQLNYLCCFTGNIDDLRKEAKELDAAVAGLEQEIERKRDDLEDPINVEPWLTESKEIQSEISRILSEAANVGSGCCSKLGARSLSRTAKKTTESTKVHRDGKPTAQFLPRPNAATKEVELGNTFECESRNEIEEAIMKTLTGGDKNMIGICGMGGLGKTTMATKIMNKALKENIFKEVVIVTFSQKVDISTIQDKIGGQLGLKKLKDETSESARARLLLSRLSDDKRTTLLVLDDVWGRPALKRIGIPLDSKWCKIIFTSRNSDVLHKMGVQIFRMEVLSKEEAWSFFRERAGSCVDDADLNPIAEEVAKECGGLPINLAAVGAVLKDKPIQGVWRDLLRKLKKSVPDNVEYDEENYNPLKLSYEYLDSKEAQSIFLMCCLFPEDADISLEYLTNFCMGLGVFEDDITNMQQARDLMCAMTEFLKDRSLLLESDKKDYVRMHDVVRDVCTSIAKEEGYIGKDGCTWISSSHFVGESKENLSESRCSNLRLLFSNDSSGFDIHDAFGKAMIELHVLYIARYSLTTLPDPAQSLGNLNTLILDSCDELETISVVTKLVNLETLICRNCRSITELPSEMKGLNHLKVLDLTGCENLQSIGRGIIKSLVRLEELKMLDSFNGWEERENASINELEALPNLACLEIHIPDHSLFTENTPHLSKKIVRFIITSGYQDRKLNPRPKEVGARSQDSKSRNEIEEEIMTALRDGDENMIGICGMGGVGKTTMATNIMKRALKEDVFREFVFVSVSQKVDISKIQDVIGEQLWLESLKEEKSQSGRAQLLLSRLSDTKRTTLLVLDDVWDTPPLESIGIPRRSQGCRILFTSRNRDVLHDMDDVKIFGMQVLSEDEAWSFFRERAGTCVDDPELNPIAKQVVKECGGFPINLAAVGAELKDKRILDIWKDALRKLKTGVQDNVQYDTGYQKLSYDGLESKEAQFLFLLCSLFPEDAHIPLDYLTYFCMALGISEDIITNMEEARNSMHYLTDKLKDRSLLLESDKEDCVRMHDVVRDACTSIAKEEGFIGKHGCTWISSSHLVGEGNELLSGSRCPDLHLLVLDSRYDSSGFKFNDAFLEGMRQLRVLCIERYSLTALPRPTQSLGKLHTLILDSCYELETISVVGELLNLEILVCRSCHSIEKLPSEIKGLKCLKVLELTWCRKLQSIGRGVISSLVSLEELKLHGSFKRWEERENASLKELEALFKLTWLEIDIQDLSLVTENMLLLSRRIARFTIRSDTDAYLLS